MRGRPEVFSQFKEGVNQEAAPYSLDIGQAREALNVHSTPTGSIKKRYGCPKLASPEVTLTSLFGCNFTTDVLLGAGGKKIFKISTTGTVTALKEGLTENANWEWIQAPKKEAKGPIFGINGSNTPQYWDGEAAETKNWTATKGSVPNGEFIAYWENRVYIAKESTLYWCAITDPFNWESPEGGSTQFDPEDGQNITGIGFIGPYLGVWKNRKTFLVTDSNTGAYRRISSELGCASHRSIVSTDIGTFFFTPDGELIITDGQSFNRNIQIPILPTLNSVSGTLKKKVCSVSIEGFVYISLSKGGSVNDVIIEYDINNNAWWVHTIAYSSSVTGAVNQFAILDPSSSVKLYGAGANTTTKRVFECFVENKYSDNESNAYKAFWSSPWHVFQMPHLRKRIREVRVDALGTFNFYSNKSFSSESEQEEVDNWESSSEGSTFGGSGKFGGTGTFGDEAVIAEKHFYTLGVGRAWSFKFESNDIQNLEIYSYTVNYEYKKD